MPVDTQAEDAVDARTLAGLLAGRREAVAGLLRAVPLGSDGWADLAPLLAAPRVRFAGGGDGCEPSDGDGPASYDTPEPAKANFDAKTGVARFLITTPARDRMGDVVEPYGCMGRMDRYKANPVVFFGHKSYGLPIGSAVKADGTFGVEVGEHVRADGTSCSALYSSVRFHCKTRESEDVAALVEAGDLRAASIGFIPLKAKVRRRPDPDPSAPRDETTFDPYLTFHFLEWELIEWSVVGVPANPDCAARRLSKGVGSRPLSDGVRRLLAPFAVKSVWSPGATLPAAPATQPPAGEAAALAFLARFYGDAARDLRTRVAATGGEVGRFLAVEMAQASAARDRVIEFALTRFPDVDFSAGDAPASAVVVQSADPHPHLAELVARQAELIDRSMTQPAERAEPAPPTPATPEPTPVKAAPSAAQLAVLSGAVGGLAEQVKRNAAALRRVTGRID